MKTVMIVPPKPIDELQSGIGTRVLSADGSEIENVTKVTVSFEPESLVTAEIELAVSISDISAHPLLGLDTLREAAEAHGYELVPVDAVASTPLATGVTRYDHVKA